MEEYEWSEGEYICPHCGYKNRDISEYGEGEHYLECGECEEKITLSVHVMYRYSTVKDW